MAAISPKDVIKIVESTINFLQITVLGESLSPSTQMECQETAERLTSLVQKLHSVKSFSLHDDGDHSKKRNSFLKKSSKDSSIKSDPSPSSNSHSTLKRISDSSSKTDVSPSPNLHSTLKKAAGQSVSKRVECLKSKLKALSKLSYGELKECSDHSGVLRKNKKKLLSMWNRRFCILRDGIMFYFCPETDMKLLGYIVLGCYKLVVVPNKTGFCFSLESADTVYSFQADTKEDGEIWMQHLEKVVNVDFDEEERIAINSFRKEVENKNIGGVQSESDKDEDSNHDDIVPQSMQKKEREEKTNNLPSITTSSPPLSSTPLPTMLLTESEDKLQAAPLSPTDDMYEVLPESASIGLRSSSPEPLYAPKKLPGSKHFVIENVYVGEYDCEASDPEDLSFCRGDIMYILEKINFDWWIAFLNGKVGLVPSNFVRCAFVM